MLLSRIKMAALPFLEDHGNVTLSTDAPLYASLCCFSSAVWTSVSPAAMMLSLCEMMLFFCLLFWPFLGFFAFKLNPSVSFFPSSCFCSVSWFQSWDHQTKQKAFFLLHRLFQFHIWWNLSFFFLPLSSLLSYKQCFHVLLYSEFIAFDPCFFFQWMYCLAAFLFMSHGVDVQKVIQVMLQYLAS